MESGRRRPASDMLAERAAAWPEATPVVARLATTLLRCAHLMLKRSVVRVGRRGLTFTEFETLATLRGVRAPHELTAGAIGASIIITSGGLSKVLAALSERGLVTRPAGDGDRREKPVRLTTEGRSLIENVMADIIDADTDLVASALSASETERLTALVGRLLAWVEQATETELERKR